MIRRGATEPSTPERKLQKWPGTGRKMKSLEYREKMAHPKRFELLTPRFVVGFFRILSTSHKYAKPSFYRYFSISSCLLSMNQLLVIFITFAAFWSPIGTRETLRLCH